LTHVKGGAVNITYQDENELLNAVGTAGPVSVAFQVLPDFKLYVGGIYSNPNCSSSAETVNHAVLNIGWGEENGVEYWIVKNSWS